MFAGVTAPILLISAFAVVIVASSSGDDGLSPSPPRSDVAGVCVETTPDADGSTDCGTPLAQSGLSVQTPTPVPPSPTPAPRTYTVRSGDTLSVICASQAADMAVDDCVAAIVELSDLGGPDQLAVGQVLNLPRANGASSSPGTTSQRASATATQAPVVAETPAAQDPEAESTRQASLVAIGPQVAEDVAAVPPEDDEASEPAEVVAEEDTEDVEAVTEVEDETEDEPATDEEVAASEGTEYAVDDGDSLIGICATQVTEMTEDECVEFVVLLNGLSGPDEIYSGQTLILP